MRTQPGDVQFRVPGLRHRRADVRRSAVRRLSHPWALALGVALLGAAGWASSPRTSGHASPAPAQPARAFHSPYDLAFSPDGRRLAVSDRTADQVEFLEPTDGRVVRRVALAGPTNLTWSGSRLFVSEGGARDVAEIDGASGRVVRRFAVGPRPMGVACAPRRGLLVAACADLRYVALLDMATGKERLRIACAAEPYGVAVTPDESLAIVGNLVPAGPSTDPNTSAALTLIDLRTLHRLSDIRLPSGATGVRGIAVSPDSKWAYVVHSVGRFNLPTTQLDRGWVNTNALTVIDLSRRSVYTTMLLDQVQEGAADPWGVAISRDGGTLWISLSGVHQTARIDLARLHPLLAGVVPAGSPLLRMSGDYEASSRNTWAEIHRDPAQRAELINDLSALRIADLITTTPLAGYGPRGIALSPDGKTVAVGMYFSGAVHLLSAGSGADKSCSLGPEPPADGARIGERMFHDATLSYQHWLSCATCHPDGRADGLNWDLLNDGVGNPKNTRSLLQAQLRAPMMAQGVRPGIHVAVAAGFRFIEFHEPQPGEERAIEAFIGSMRPERSPYLLPDGRLSASALRGKLLFESPRAGCSGCHRGQMLTDQRLHDVGTRSDLDNSARFVTPTLIEVWRTAPYLHDGRAVTLAQLFAMNRGDRHGVTSRLTRPQLADLASYVLSQ